ncbi:YceD family protein [Variovorax sp. LT1R16]|uniref:YceD family protein n=1 Tax=Variovorax sp. LT1R16 TaxID=3443728 RepID=UPI003F48B4C8
MNREFVPSRLDVTGFAEAAAILNGSDPVVGYARLSAELAESAPDAQVVWTAQGENRTGGDGAPVAWLHLHAEATLPFVCQRCLAPVTLDLEVDRWFRFAADEEAAAIEDEESDEDVLVAARDFDLKGLIEDELLMEIPVTPRHEVCPVPVQLSAADADFEEANEARPNPFAVLGELKKAEDK